MRKEGEKESAERDLHPFYVSSDLGEGLFFESPKRHKPGLPFFTVPLLLFGGSSSGGGGDGCSGKQGRPERHVCVRRRSLVRVSLGLTVSVSLPPPQILVFAAANLSSEERPNQKGSLLPSFPDLEAKDGLEEEEEERGNCARENRRK